MKHLDMVGVEIKQGDFVAGGYSSPSGLAIYVVVRIAPKTLALRKYDVKAPRGSARRYSKDLIKLSDEQTKYLLFTVVKGTAK